MNDQSPPRLAKITEFNPGGSKSLKDLLRCYDEEGMLPLGKVTVYKAVLQCLLIIYSEGTHPEDPLPLFNLHPLYKRLIEISINVMREIIEKEDSTSIVTLTNSPYEM